MAEHPQPSPLLGVSTWAGVGKAVLKFSTFPRPAEGFQAQQIQNRGGEVGSCQRWGDVKVQDRVLPPLGAKPHRFAPLWRGEYASFGS